MATGSSSGEEDKGRKHKSLQCPNCKPRKPRKCSRLSFLRNFNSVQCSQASFSDITVRASDGRTFAAHRFILASKSEVFKAMFEADGKEKETREVVIEDVPSESIRLFLSFLYSARLPWGDLSDNILEGIVRVSRKYEVHYLLRSCDKYMVSKVCGSDNVFGILRMAYLYDLKSTKKAAIDFICSRREKMEEILDYMRNRCSELGGNDVSMVYDVFRRHLEKPSRLHVPD